MALVLEASEGSRGQGFGLRMLDALSITLTYPQDPIGIQLESMGFMAPFSITVTDLEVKGSSAKAQTAGLKDRGPQRHGAINWVIFYQILICRRFAGHYWQSFPAENGLHLPICIPCVVF